MDLKVTRPCPVDLDARGVDRSGLSFRCDHCERDVHVLSNMSRAAATRLLEARRGERVCVSFRRTEEGRILFADDPPEDAAPPPVEATPLVPLSRLRRLGALPRAAGVSLLLAACAPHGASPTVADDDAVAVLERDPIPAPSTTPAPPSDLRAVEGQAALAEPCVKEPTEELADAAAEEPDAPATKRPARRSPTDKKPRIEIVDGGI